jgi:hypothetical protein
LIFEGKAAKRKSHESHARRRAAETRADDASPAVLGVVKHLHSPTGKAYHDLLKGSED